MDVQQQDTEIYHVIYASTAVERLSQNSLIELMKISRRNNHACGLTGMLLYRDGIYLQFLEGHRGHVETLLSRLQRDRRHTAIRVLRDGALPHRLFADWSMAYKNLAGLRSTHVLGYSELLQGHYVNRGGRGPAQMLVELFDEILVA